MPPSSVRPRKRLNLSFFGTDPVHLGLTVCGAILCLFCVLAGHGKELSAFGQSLGTGTLLIAGTLALPAVLHDVRDFRRRDASLMIPWGILFIVLIKQSILIATARAFPLRDQLFRHWDESLGLRIPDLMRWASHYALGQLVSRSYVWLEPMMIGAVLLPLIFARPLSVRRYVLANAVAIVVALPCILLLPAIGPWVGWGFAPDSAQHAWDLGFRAVRAGTANDTNTVASVCLPSFHVFWALASAQALWFLRWLRIPVLVLAAFIVCSTLTTGWHYGVDIIAGLALWFVSTAAAHALTRRSSQSPVKLLIEAAAVAAGNSEFPAVPETVSPAWTRGSPAHALSASGSTADHLQ